MADENTPPAGQSGMHAGIAQLHRVGEAHMSFVRSALRALPCPPQVLGSQRTPSAAGDQGFSNIVPYVLDTMVTTRTRPPSAPISVPGDAARLRLVMAPHAAGRMANDLALESAHLVSAIDRMIDRIEASPAREHVIRFARRFRDALGALTASIDIYHRVQSATLVWALVYSRTNGDREVVSFWWPADIIGYDQSENLYVSLFMDEEAQLSDYTDPLVRVHPARLRPLDAGPALSDSLRSAVENGPNLHLRSRALRRARELSTTLRASASQVTVNVPRIRLPPLADLRDL